MEKIKAKTAYEYLFANVARGSRFYIDLVKKDMKVGNEYVIKGGEIVEDSVDGYISPAVRSEFGSDPWKYVERLYDAFQNSVPGEKRLGSPPYFNCKSYDELDEWFLAMGEMRDLAQALLEGWILCASLDGILKWEFGNKFFIDLGDGLIVLKNWIE